ncbi:MAG: hypothetical protein GX334_05005 [Firmicutes bacterium]|nr:hypothetical protein [Bacillota bacterium]
MQGNKNSFRRYLHLLLTGFVLFSFLINFSLQEGELALAYNMNNLERNITLERLVQNPEGNLDNSHIHVF